MKFLMCHIVFIGGDKMNNIHISRCYRNGPNVLSKSTNKSFGIEYLFLLTFLVVG